jgi:hypothetical protein
VITFLSFSDICFFFSIKGEDIKSLVEKHGFVLKSFEEMYIMKSGPLLRQGDPLGKQSPLVGAKRSDKIKLDVCFTPVTNTTLKEEVSDSPKVAGIKRVSPEKPETVISDSAKRVKVSDQTQLELQPIRGPQEADQLAAIIPERPIDVPVIPLLPLPSPPFATGPVPLIQVPDAHRAVTSKLTAVSPTPPRNNQLHLSSSIIVTSDQKVGSTKENEVETIPMKKSEENTELFRENLRPIFRFFFSFAPYEKLSASE